MKFTEVIESTEKFKRLVDKVATDLEQANPTVVHIHDDIDNYNLVAMMVFALIEENKRYFLKCSTEMLTEENCRAYQSFDTYSKLFGHKGVATVAAFNSLAISLLSGYCDYWDIIDRVLFVGDPPESFVNTRHLLLVETAYRAVYGEPESY